MLSDVTQRSWPQPIIIPPLSQNVRLRPGGRDDWVLWYFCVHDGNPKVRMQNWFVWLRLQLSRSTLILPHRRLSCCHRQIHTVKRKHDRPHVSVPEYNMSIYVCFACCILSAECWMLCDSIYLDNVVFSCFSTVLRALLLLPL